MPDEQLNREQYLKNMLYSFIYTTSSSNDLVVKLKKKYEKELSEQHDLDTIKTFSR